MDSFSRFVLDQLGQVASDVRGRKMFGGLGIYSGKRFFALVAYDSLWLKADDQTRGDFEAVAWRPFQPWPDKPTVMSYYEVPLEVLESISQLRPWVEKALAAAERKLGDS